MSEDPVVITGLGTVSSAGLGAEALLAALKEGRPRVTAVDRARGYHSRGAARNAALVNALDASRFVPPLLTRRMSRPSLYAVVAALMALRDAEIEPPAERDRSISVAIATAFGPSSSSQALLDQILTEGPEAASPAVFTECVSNAPAAQVAILCKASGSNHTICEREAGVLMAVAQGAAEIRSGRARVALVGAVEEMTPLVHALLDRFRAVARPNDMEPEAARPFDRSRNGFLAAEGATMLVLEAASTVRQRRGRIRASVRGWHHAFDASASRLGWGTGVDVLARGAGRCLRACALDPQQIDAIVSGASGSRAGDRLEASILRRLWSALALPPILAPKGVTGEYGGAFLAAAVLAAGGAACGPTAGFRCPDPELAIVPHDGSRLAGIRRVLVSSLASGGSASWLVLEGA